MLVLAATAAAGAVVPNLNAAVKRQVVVWSERTTPKDVYPNDINEAIAEGLRSLPGWDVLTANIDQPDQGVPDSLLHKTDVLIWWGHKRHDEVKDSLVDRIEQRVKQDGMGFIAVHSSHFAKPYKRLMGTACSWREYENDGSALHVSVKTPSHPIAKGIVDFYMPATERYGEPFVVPPPETVVFDGVYTHKDGKKEQSRQGLIWTIGKGRVFYLQIGHESYPMMFDPNVRKIMRNAVAWAAPKA